MLLQHQLITNVKVNFTFVNYMTRTNLITANKCSAIVFLQWFTVLPRVATRVGGDDHGWRDVVPIGRIRTHYALALDAKAAIAFPARRDRRTGDQSDTLHRR